LSVPEIFVTLSEPESFFIIVISFFFVIIIISFRFFFIIVVIITTFCGFSSSSYSGFSSIRISSIF